MPEFISRSLVGPEPQMEGQQLGTKLLGHGIQVEEALQKHLQWDTGDRSILSNGAAGGIDLLTAG
jgi:hypothetical protein